MVHSWIYDYRDFHYFWCWFNCEWYYIPYTQLLAEVMVNENNNGTEVDHLALGLTRSPTFMGVNIRVFFANVVLCTLICINAHTFFGIPLFIIIHLLALRFSLKEPDFFYIKAKSLIKTPPVLNRWYWGKTNSYEPW